MWFWVLFTCFCCEGEGEGGNENSKQSRSDKKSRKAVLKLGMKAVSDVSRVTIKRSKNVKSNNIYSQLIFLVEHRFWLCELWYIRCYLSSRSQMFTRVPMLRLMSSLERLKIDDLSSQLQTQAAQRFKMPDMISMLPNDASEADMAPLAEEEDEDDVDDTGVEARDIDLVMTQAGVSKAKAVKALKASDGDIVSAIMELTI